MSEVLRLGDPTVQISPNQRRPHSQTQEAIRLPAKLNGHDFLFTVTLGSITESNADAILCPSNPWFGLAAGAVENAIMRDAGTEPFDAADRYMEKEEVKIPGFTRENGVPYGAARAFPSGDLADNGIKSIIFSNVLPSGERLTPHMVARCIGNALLEADKVGAESLAVPAIGTGFLGAMQGFSLAESIEGTLLGMEEYMKDAFGERSVKSLSLVIYAQANERNAQEMRDYLEEAVDRLPGIEKLV